MARYYTTTNGKAQNMKALQRLAVIDDDNEESIFTAADITDPRIYWLDFGPDGIVIYGALGATRCMCGYCIAEMVYLYLDACRKARVYAKPSMATRPRFCNA